MDSIEPPSLGFLINSVPLLVLAVTATYLGFTLLLLLFLLVCSAMISGAEVAYFSLSPADLHALGQEQSITSKRILQLRDKPRILLATILISNNFVNVTIVILSDVILSSLLPEVIFKQWSLWLTEFKWLSLLDPDKTAYVLEYSLTVVAATFLLVLFGEVAPKIYSNVNNRHMARLMSGPLVFLRTLFYPLSRILVNLSNKLENRLNYDPSKNKGRKGDLDKAIELTVSHEQNAEKETDILKRIVKFGDVNVKQIMRSRVDVIAIDITSGFQEVMRVVRDSGYSRIPVYEDDFDNIQGILYVKDLLEHLNKADDFDWRIVLRKDVKFVPEAKRINELLTEFQLERTHIAIVVDEFGGSAGLVTLEDIMEEVIGDIKDEFDEEVEVEFEKLDDYNFIFEGKTLLNDLCRVVHINTDTFEEIKGADSIAGLILELAGKIPRRNSEIRFKDYRFKILAVSAKRIEKIQITLPNETTYD